jgi:hypothetical protein
MKVSQYILLFLFCTCFTVHAQNVKSAYANDILKFRQIDSLTPPPENPILFVGSSSFTMWTDMQDYFPSYVLINRAYGGSQLCDLINDFEEVVLRYNPQQLVIYCGENDFAYSDTVSVEEVFCRFQKYFCMVRTSFPDAKITFVSLKPSPSRWHLENKFKAANKEIKHFLKKQKNSSFVDVGSKMLNKSKLPKPEIYLEDQLHMNSAGYKIWQKAIEPHLIK